MAATPASIKRGLPLRERITRKHVIHNIQYNYRESQGPVSDILWSPKNEEILPLPGIIPERLSHVPTEDLTRGLKIGIIGAGVSGLFTGMILDFLNQNIPELNLSYEILEAADEDRLGGRLYTYNFPTQPERDVAQHNYYDVGGMRFPDISIMKRYAKLLIVSNRGSYLHLEPSDYSIF